jgi:uncharacterized glyoxalase superfamily protein PhnB
VKKLTPVLVVDSIEPVHSFWVDRLGFEETMRVMEGDRLGFVAFTKGPVELMYQTVESIRADVAELAETPTGAAMLFLEVNDLDRIEAALDGVEKVVPRRQTFYGSDEIVVREPGGNVVVFAYYAAKD